MADEKTTEALADELDALGDDGGTDGITDLAALRSSLEQQAERWRQWIDELRVRVDLGGMDAREGMGDLLGRLEDAYTAFVSIAKQAADGATGTVGDLRSKGSDAAADLRSRGADAVGDLRAKGTDAVGDLRSKGTDAASDLRSRGGDALGDLRTRGNEVAHQLNRAATTALDRLRRSDS